MTTSVLKMQRELVAVTEERDRLAAELAKLREQKPVGYVDRDTLNCMHDEEWQALRGVPANIWTVDAPPSRAIFPLYAAPMAAPAVQLADGSDDYYEHLGALVEQHPVGIMRHNTDKQVPAVPAPSVPEECKNCKKAWAMTPIAWYRKRSDGGIEGPLMDDDSRMCAFRRKEWTPLYERPFYPDFLNYRQGFNDGIEEIRHELKQLCKDFSDLQNRPYMGDVHAQVDAICARALLQSAEGRCSQTHNEVRHD